jgi:N-acyl-D-amino-acid deacylase
MYDLLFRAARVVDGSGSPWYRADVAVKDGRVAAIGRLGGAQAACTIDCQDAVLAPGFVDLHVHSDLNLLVEPRHEAKLFQGVTIELLGQDGLSYAPISRQKLPLLRRFLGGLNGDPPIDWDWSSVAEFLAKFDRRVAPNVAFLIPLCAIRAEVMGFDARQASADELARMRALIAEGMQDGAVGLSTGLTYPINAWTTTDDLVELCSEVARYGGIYVTHMRYTLGAGLLEPIAEAIEIGERAGLPTHISHFKGARGGVRDVAGALGLIDRARARGLDVTLDAYPYNAGSTMLQASLPMWLHEGGPDRVLERLTDRTVRQRVGEAFAARPPVWSDYTLASVGSARNRALEGRPLSDLIAESGKDQVDWVCDLLLEEELRVSCRQADGQTDDDIIPVLQHPAMMVGSDGLHLGSAVHRRTYGTFARILGRYVRELGALRLEEAVRKMTSASAARIGQSDRGLVRPGLWADLVVFEPETIAEQATWEQPRRLARGVRQVLVNGALVLDGGQHTGATPGRALRLAGTA